MNREMLLYSLLVTNSIMQRVWENYLNLCTLSGCLVLRPPVKQEVAKHVTFLTRDLPSLAGGSSYSTFSKEEFFEMIFCNELMNECPVTSSLASCTFLQEVRS